MITRPYFSIMVPVYNAETFFAETLESVAAQTCDDWELLLTDDGSTDRSPQIAEAFRQRFPEKVRCLRHPDGGNHGISATRNVALAEARGKYLALLDADDIWEPNKLAEQATYFEQDPELALVYGRCRIWHSWTGNPADAARDWLTLDDSQTDRRIAPPELVTRFLRNEFDQPFNCDAVLRTEWVQQLGGWDARFRGMYEDNILYTKLLSRYPAYCANRVWSHYRQHTKNCCHTAMDDGQWVPGQPNPIQQEFLLWAERYLTENGIADPALQSALKAALLPYRNPALHRARQLPRQVARRIKHTLFAK